MTKPVSTSSSKSASPALSALLTALTTALLASGCAVGPAYQVASTPAPAAFKETATDAEKTAAGWTAAVPADLLERGPWWQLFNDPLLNQLAESIEISNQNVAVAAANYAQARALVAEQRAALFPVVSLNGSAARSGGGSNTQDQNQYRANIGGSWEPDIWGRLRAGANNAQASLQASAADLAATRRSAAAMSGRRCSSVDGTPVGTSGTVCVHGASASVKVAGAWPTSTAMACSSWARCKARPRSSFFAVASVVSACRTSDFAAMPALKRLLVIRRTRS